MFSQSVDFKIEICVVVTGSDYVSFAPILCGWPHSGSCVSRSEGPLENDGAMGIFGLDDFFFFFAFDRARCFFFQLQH